MPLPGATMARAILRSSSSWSLVRAGKKRDPDMMVSLWRDGKNLLKIIQP